MVNQPEGFGVEKRKDRKGHTIQKGSKIHHIAFRDEVPKDREGTESRQNRSHESNEASDDEDHNRKLADKRKRRRE